MCRIFTLTVLVLASLTGVQGALISVDGNWSRWGFYSPCTKVCGGGTHYRVRTCSNPPPSNGGNDCVGAGTESKACGTDPCTPTPKPTTTPSPTHGIMLTVAPGCVQHPADIVFSLDSSGSVGSANFKKQMDFVGQFVNSLDIGPSAVQVGVTTFSTHPVNRFWMNQHQNKADLLTAIHSIPFTSGGTHTDAALLFALNEDFTKPHGDRDNVPNILIVMTDGRSQTPAQTKAVANTIKTTTNWSVFAIGIGFSESVSELNEIATVPRNVFTVSNFNDLKNIQTVLQMTACESKPKKDLCLHNGKTYTNGPTWHDKCENICQCLDTMATNCTQECPRLGSLPSQCQLIQNSNNLCCHTLACSSPLFG